MADAARALPLAISALAQPFIIRSSTDPGAIGLPLPNESAHEDSAFGQLMLSMTMALFLLGAASQI